MMRRLRFQWIMCATLAVLAVPAVAMQITSEVAWGPGDFVIAAALLITAGLTYEMAAAWLPRRVHRAWAGVTVLAALALVWAQLAVGIV